MSLDMFGTIDNVFQSIPANRISKVEGSYVKGIYQPGAETVTEHTVTIQQASDREIQSLEAGGRRILDSRRIYINDGVLASIQPADDWEFDGQRWETARLDNRPWRNYCKAIVVRYDDQ